MSRDSHPLNQNTGYVCVAAEATSGWAKPTKTKFVAYSLDIGLIHSYIRFIAVQHWTQELDWELESLTRSPRDISWRRPRGPGSYSRVTADYLHYKVRSADRSTSARNSMAYQ